MPDRLNRSSILFGNRPQAAAPFASPLENEQELVPEQSGHYATSPQLLNDPELEQVTDADPVFSRAGERLTGYPSHGEVVSLPLPLPGAVASWLLASAPLVLNGWSLIPSAACTVQLFDGRDGSGRPALQIPLQTGGVAVMFGRVYFRRGVYLQVLGGATVDGALIVERAVDSIPR